MRRLSVALAALMGLPIRGALQPINERVQDLLSNMTVDEKVAQLFYGSAPTGKS
jgi:hypothetical protein